MLNWHSPYLAYLVTSSLEHRLYPRQDITPSSHTMGDSLRRYLEIKVHQEVLQRKYDQIIVLGSYSRHGSPSSIPFTGEKRDKPFNWERPTARRSADSKTLYIECFPGYDHIEHYAEIIASYLRILESESLPGQFNLTPSAQVSFIPSSCTDTLSALSTATNLPLFPGSGVDTVILGMVWHLSHLLASGSDCSPGIPEFEGSGGPFQWIIRRFPSSNRTAALLGFRPAFWGCISGELVHFLSRRFPSIKEFIYVGKLGTLTPGIPPNRFLATGSSSLLGNRTVRWENALAGSIASCDPSLQRSIISGKHVTLGSVLHETKHWHAAHRRSRPGPGSAGSGGGGVEIDFVDPEIGNMAQAAVRSGARYGYLHLITDNLAQKYDEDLSNERTEGVLNRRARLYRVVSDVIEFHLNRTTVDGQVIKRAPIEGCMI